MIGNKNTECHKRPPGVLLKRLTQQNRMFERILSHMHVLEIIDDHELMWFEASTTAEKYQVHRRFRWQLARAVANVVGFEFTVHGTVAAFAGDFSPGGSFFIIGVAILYIINLKGQ